MSKQENNKVWKTVALFKTFAEADKERNALSEKHALVKVRRLASGYKVKIWDPPLKKEFAEKKASIALKKGQNNNRKRKSKNKKLREDSSV